MKRRNQTGKIGIRTRLLLSFGAYTVLFVALLWVLQAFFLNFFYESIKISQVKVSAASLTDKLDDDDVARGALAEIMKKYEFNVLITESSGKMLYSVHGQNDPFTRMGPTEYKRLYNDTMQNGGKYFLRRTSNETETGNDIRDLLKNTETAEYYLYAVTVTTPQGNERLILVYCDNLVPLSSTVETLHMQLVCVSVIMLIVALAIALVLASHISKPIVQMNESAAKLAMGNYEVHFEEKGTRETVELAQSLNYAAHELSKVDSLQKELMANVSHDLRTPLTMITGYSEVMRDLPGENTPENVQVIIDESKRLTALVNDMLDLSKLQSGNQTLNKSVFNVTQTVRTILQRYDKLLGYDFIFECDQDAFVCADELKMTQVLYNLVNNAINYSGEPKRVIVRQTVTDKTVRMDVIDNGEGIAPDKLQDIWERYYKVDKEHKRSQVGTGLGLSIVKGILDLHGNDFGVNSTVGVGSDFWFTMDLANGAAQKAENSEPKESALTENEAENGKNREEPVQTVDKSNKAD